MCKNRCIIAIISVLFFFVSCGDSVDDMLDQYNEGFDVGYTTVASTSSDDSLKPGDYGFNSSSMLHEEYYVRDDATLNLAAPKVDGATYKWWVTDPLSETPEKKLEITYYNGYTNTTTATRTFVIYIPDSGLESPHTYAIHLVVTCNGNVYQDDCGLITYKHVYEYK